MPDENQGAGGASENESTPVQSEAAPAPAAQQQQQEQPQYVPMQEFQRVQQELSQMSQFLRETFGEEEPEPDPSQYSQAELAYLAAQQGIQPYAPMLQAAVEQQGRQKFDSLMEQHEQNPEIGKVDRKLAQYAAEAMIREAGGDPVKAVELGARYAAQVQKELGSKAVEDFKKSLKGPGQSHEPFSGGGGEKAVEPAKDYDEVISRWAGQSEV